MEKNLISPIEKAKQIYFDFIYNAPMHNDNKQRALDYVNRLIDGNPNQRQYWEDVKKSLYEVGA